MAYILWATPHAPKTWQEALAPLNINKKWRDQYLSFNRKRVWVQGKRCRKQEMDKGAE